MTSLSQDVRYSLRMLLKTQGFYRGRGADAGAGDWCQYSHVQCAEYVPVSLAALPAVRTIGKSVAHVSTLSKLAVFSSKFLRPARSEYGF